MPRKKTLPPHVILKGKKGNKKWHVRLFFATDRRYPNGKTIYDEVTRRCEPETAERAADLVKEIEEDYLAARQLLEASAPSSCQTLSEFFLVWLDNVRHSVEQRTYEDYSELYERYIKERLGNRLLAEITPLDVQRLYNEVSKKVAASVVHKVHIVVSSVFKQAIRWKVLTENPTADLILPKIETNEAKSMTRAEVRRLAQALKKKPEYIVLEFAFETGMRPEEYLAVTWDDIDLEKCTVKVRRAVSFARKGGGFTFKETKTKAGRRTITFSPQMRDRLLAHREDQIKLIEGLENKIKELQRERRKKFVPKTNKGRGANRQKRLLQCENAKERLENYKTYNLVFPSSKGLPQSINNLGRREFKEALQDAGINTQEYSLYSLRHTHASILADRLNARRLQKRLGHSSLTTSLKYYVHVNEDSDHEASGIISDLLY
jgi:Site-specific recombinase XerD